jgi:hypothetical protein
VLLADCPTFGRLALSVRGKIDLPEALAAVFGAAIWAALVLAELVTTFFNPAASTQFHLRVIHHRTHKYARITLIGPLFARMP